MALEELPVVGCGLDSTGVVSQRDRYRRLGRSVEGVERSGRRLTVELGAGVDDELLRETLAVERACCPFLELRYDARRRRLEVTVDDSEREPALAALVSALGWSDGPTRSDGPAPRRPGPGPPAPP